jgi:Rhs element Vgr protein
VSEALLLPNAAQSDLVSYELLVDGVIVPINIAVTNIKVNAEINKISTAKIKIAAGDIASNDFPVSNSEQFLVGSELEIKLGYHGENISVFKGIIIAQSNSIASSGGSHLNIEAKNKAVKMTVGRRSKHFNDMTDSEMVEEIIGKYGLEKEIESTTISYPNVVQYDITDWDFILMRMDRIGLICKIEDGKIVFKKPNTSASPVTNIQFGMSILNYDALVDAREQTQTITAHAWDYNALEALDASAIEPSIAKEAGNFTISALSDTLGVDDYKLVHGGKLSQEEIQAWADAKAQKQRLAKVSGNVQINGSSDVVVDSFVGLNGVGERFNGPVYVKAVKHEFESGTWKTDIQFGMNPQWYAETIAAPQHETSLGYLPTINGLTVGIVTDLEDPLDEARVRIKLPSVSTEEEGVWARIASLDAGNERGFFFRPEVGDEVIVGCIHGDSSQLVILGMLHGGANKPPLTAANANDEKGYTSREKMVWIFNDGEKSIKIETPGGKKILISEMEDVIQLEDNFSNKILMDSSGITISATNINFKATANVKMEGAGISIESSGVCAIKGSIVNIN